MDLRDYLHLLRRNWILIAGLTAVGLLLSASASLLVKPTYTADTQLFVAIQNSGTVQELQQGNTFSQARVQSYVKTVTSPIVLQPAIDELGLEDTAEQLASKVRATADLNTVLINISAVDESPARAAAIAQAVANSLVKAIDGLESPKAGGTSPVRLSVISPAVAPTTPSAPNTRMNIVVGLLAGLAAGAGAAVLRTTLDTRVRGEADVRRITEAAVLGGIAFSSDVAASPLLTQTGSQSPRAESFRQLRTNLRFADISGSAKTLAVTSSLPGEGKSTTAVNLAIAMAQSGQSVCLIDADLRRPMVGDYLNLDQNVGLTTVLIGAADINDVLQPWGDDRLFVMTSGRIPPNPSEILGSDEMKTLVARLEQVFDCIIIDAPPLLPVTDAAVLSQHVGGVVVVVGSQKVRQQELVRALESLEMVDAKLLGVVLNRLPGKGPDAYAYGYYSSNEKASSTQGAQKAGLRTRPGDRPQNAMTVAGMGLVQDDTSFSAPARRANRFPKGPDSLSS
ncbi:polysaccharide biosynthesis tyrosine autokinase [Arthrobacter sp. TS-15]|uniref:polysaccharide biosynthesis tyrosine autokinase n=1 Tax=Arthrobacter sp. TS-15 TaxID=2510797 RepID=UPI00115CEB3A|nr:polysaccharide biosynthesis tyrosine autokinase [Arthrobacter sp. TS-15]TQS92789.1 polysaccharide biosynthesis tyrosine autokinase [Arthrobacter sp. TS-15]